MPDPDDTLSEIDSAIEDYVTWHGSADAGVWKADVAEDPEHRGTYNELQYWSDNTSRSVRGEVLNHVATPEEAARGPRESVGSPFDALWSPRHDPLEDLRSAMREVARPSRPAPRFPRPALHRDDAAILALLTNAIRSRTGMEVTEVTVERSWVRFETRVSATDGSLSVVYSMTDDIRVTEEMVFVPVEVVYDGGRLALPPHQDAFQILRYPSPGDLEDPSYEVATIDLAPIRISLGAPGVYGRGANPHLVVIDELAEATTRVGASAQQAAAALADLGAAPVPEPDQEVPLPAPLARSGRDGQRSPYGPPSRRRRR